MNIEKTSVTTWQFRCLSKNNADVCTCLVVDVRTKSDAISMLTAYHKTLFFVKSSVKTGWH